MYTQHPRSGLHYVILSKKPVEAGYICMHDVLLKVMNIIINGKTMSVFCFALLICSRLSVCFFRARKKEAETQP